MELISQLSWWQWAILAAVPPAIVALYFLKLKRQPLEVPSTYLWHKSIEDLHVNSLWQRMRQSLLLFLQLLFVALVMLALLGPSWMSTRTIDDRLIFLVDNSASMSATDDRPSRLEQAKALVEDKIGSMSSGTTAMVISFSDVARVEQGDTSDKRLLLEALKRIQPTSRSTAPEEALRLAAGLANPSKSGGVEDWDQRAAEPMPATLYVYSDGKFADVQGFSLGHLAPVFVPLGDKAAENQGIVAFGVRRNEERAEKLQAFGRVENFGDQEHRLGADLLLNGRQIDAAQLVIKPHDSAGVAFDLPESASGVLELRLDAKDALADDNRAWIALATVRPAKVLLVTAGNPPLEKALATEQAAALAEVTKANPSVLKTRPHQQAAAAGFYDLIIYDDCRPEQMPQANTFFLGQLPPAPGWSVDRQVNAPQIIDAERSHPIMQWVDTGDVAIGSATALLPPPGSSRLLDSTKGLLFAVGPREGFEDAVLGFPLLARNEAGEVFANTTWHVRQSFPTLILEALRYLGGGSRQLASESVRPGANVELRSDSAREMTVRSPSGRTATLQRGVRNAFHFGGTDELGVYEVLEQGRPVQQFTVNLFDARESDIRPRPENSIRIGYVDVQGQSALAASRLQGWKYLALLALGVLLLEWYIYNRRTYI